MYLYPRLLVVPVDASVSLTCEIHYNGTSAYSARLRIGSEIINLSHYEVNNSILHHTLNVRSEYKNALIDCEMTIHDSDSIPEVSNNITLNAIREGNASNWIPAL